MTPSFVQILIVVALLVLLFGRGKISGLMGDVAKGIKSFKKGMQEEPETETAEDVKTIDHDTVEPVETAKKTANTKAET